MDIDSRKVQLSERDIEDYLWDNPEKVPTVERWIARQVDLPNGRLDMLGINKFGAPVIVELKNTSVSSDALTQVFRYAFDIQSILEVKLDYPEEHIHVSKIVIGVGEPTTRVLQEAEAMGIRIMAFNLFFDVGISQWGLTFDYQQQRTREHFGLASQDIFSEFVTHTKEELPESPPEEAGKAST